MACMGTPGGEANDAPMAEFLLGDLSAGAYVVAHKSYDADWIREQIEAQDACDPASPTSSLRQHYL